MKYWIRWTDVSADPICFLSDSVVWVTIGAGKEFQIFMIRLKKKCLILFDQNLKAIVTSGARAIGN